MYSLSHSLVYGNCSVVLVAWLLFFSSDVFLRWQSAVLNFPNRWVSAMLFMAFRFFWLRFVISFYSLRFQDYFFLNLLKNT